MTLSQPTPQDFTLDLNLGFIAETWRVTPYTPSFTQYAPASVNVPLNTYYDPSFFTDFQFDTYYGPDQEIQELLQNPNTIDLKSLYGEVFWDAFFDQLFPSITEQDFLSEDSTGTPGGYFVQLYTLAMGDFYRSFFVGQDDSTGSETLLSAQVWATLSEDQQQLIIGKYFLTRADYPPIDVVGDFTIDMSFTPQMHLNQLESRATNLFVYIAQLMVGIMSQLQSNTINAAQYATRLAQTQQAISTEMGSDKYQYQLMTSPTDFVTQLLNQNNGQTLENLRVQRNMIQKQTDQASAFLQTAQQAVEDNSDKAMELLKKGYRLVTLFTR